MFICCEFRRNEVTVGDGDLKLVVGFLRFTYCEAHIYGHVQAQFEKWQKV